MIENVSKRISPFNFLTFFLVAAASIYILSREIIMHPDSTGYLLGSVIRSPVYPVFLQIVKITGEHIFFPLLTFIQLIIGLYAIQTFSVFLFRIFNLDKWHWFAIFVFLFSPYLIGIRGANAVVSEALAYPLFLIVSKYLIEAIYYLKFRSFLLAFATTSLLILTRSQFLFLYPLIALLLIYIAIFEIKFRTLFKKIAFWFLTSIILTITLEMSYHFLAHGKFIRTPFTGIQLATNALYVSSVKDSVNINNEHYRSIFVKIMKEADSQNLTQSKRFKNMGFYSHYEISYNDLCWRTIFPTIKANIQYKNETQLFTKVDKITLSLSKIMITKNFKSFLKIYIYNAYNCFGGFINSIWILLLSFTTLRWLFMDRNNKIALILLFVLGLHWSNVLLISLVEPAIVRYVFYTQTLLFVLVFIFCIEFLKKKLEVALQTKS